MLADLTIHGDPVTALLVLVILLTITGFVAFAATRAGAPAHVVWAVAAIVGLLLMLAVLL